MRIGFLIAGMFNSKLKPFNKHHTSHFFIAFVGMVCFCNPLFSQDKTTKSELLSICKKYINSKEEMSCKVVYNYYNSKTSKALADKESGELFLWNNCFIFKISGTEMIKNENYYVAVNEAERTIFVGYSPGNQGTPLGIDMLDSLQKIADLQARFIKGNSSQLKTIRYLTAEGRTDSIDINYDPKTYIINNCKLYLGEDIKYDDQDNNPVMIVEYQNTQFKKVDAVIKEKYYAKKCVEVRGKKPVLKSAYKGYQLVNNMDN